MISFLRAVNCNDLVVVVVSLGGTIQLKMECSVSALALWPGLEPRYSNDQHATRLKELLPKDGRGFTTNKSDSP